MSAYNSQQRLDDDGNRLICILYFLARRLRDPVDRDNVFSKLGVQSFSNQEEARKQLVQHLESRQPSPIEYDIVTNKVSLTVTGQQWAQNQCDSNQIYLQYRHLENQ